MLIPSPIPAMMASDRAFSLRASIIEARSSSCMRRDSSCPRSSAAAVASNIRARWPNSPGTFPRPERTERSPAAIRFEASVNASTGRAIIAFPANHTIANPARATRERTDRFRARRRIGPSENAAVGVPSMTNPPRSNDRPRSEEKISSRSTPSAPAARNIPLRSPDIFPKKAGSTVLPGRKTAVPGCAVRTVPLSSSRT